MAQGWKNATRDGVIEWLLEEENPAVRAAALNSLMDYAPDHPLVQTAIERELESGLSARILAKMEPGGYWGKPQDFYTRSKYHGTVWSFLLLSEIGSSFGEERFRNAAEFLLSHARRIDNGGFTYTASNPGNDRPAAIPCLSGNLVWAMAQAGLYEDDRLQQAAGWLSENQYLSDGPDDPSPSKIPAGKEKSFLTSCWGDHTCMMGVVKNLKALAAWPNHNVSETMRQAIDSGVEFLLKHGLIFRSHDLSRPAKPEYLQFGFPLFWRTDAIEMLEVLLTLGINDRVMQPVLEAVKARQAADGRWSLDQSFNGRMQVRVEKVGLPSKWVTLRALKVIKLAEQAGLFA